MQVQCDGIVADVNMLPEFTSKRSPGCFSGVPHDVLEGNPDLHLEVVRPTGEDLEHLFEYTAATVDGDGRQETVYLENLDDGCLDLRADAPGGASQKNASRRGALQHRLCLSMEKDPRLSSPVYSLPSDSPHQWSEHGPETTSAGLWVTHNNDPITILSLPTHGGWGRLQPVLMPPTPQLSFKTWGGGGGLVLVLASTRRASSLCLPAMCAVYLDHWSSALLTWHSPLVIDLLSYRWRRTELWRPTGGTPPPAMPPARAHGPLGLLPSRVCPLLPRLCTCVTGEPR